MKHDIRRIGLCAGVACSLLALPVASQQGTRWVGGRVIVPANTPTDEELTVIAHGWRWAEVPEFRAPVQKDGSFRAAFAEETTRGELTLEARYLFLPEKSVVRIEELPRELVLEPRLGGRVAGRVVPPAGPIAPEELVGSTVKLSSPAASRSRTAELNANLEFAFDGVPPYWSYSLRVSGGPVLDAKHGGIEVRAGETTNVELTVALGARVRGRVVDEAGTALAGVVVGSQAGHGTATSDASGAFELGGLRPGELVLLASKRGYRPAELALGTLAEGELRYGADLVLSAGSSIAGQVLWEGGQPAAGARVAVGHVEARTAVDGSFTLGGLGEGPFVVRASAVPAELIPAGEEEEDYLAPPSWTELGNVTAGSQGLSLVLQRGFELPGQVRDESGAPLTNFVIRALPADSRLLRIGDDGISRGFRSATGDFTLENLWKGRWVVIAKARGFAWSTPLEVTLPWQGGDVELVLSRLASARGVVLDSAGQPVAGAPVFAVKTDPEATGDPRELERTAKDGTFSMDDLEPGLWELIAGGHAFVESAAVQLALAPGQAVDGMVFSVQRKGSLTGELDPALGAVAGVDVRISWIEGGSSEVVRSNQNGRFALEDLSPGTYRLGLPTTSEKPTVVRLNEGKTVHVVLGAPARQKSTRRR